MGLESLWEAHYDGMDIGMNSRRFSACICFISPQLYDFSWTVMLYLDIYTRLGHRMTHDSASLITE